jgi:hypothetical protein
MRRFAALTSALALGLACAVLLAACGGSGGGTLSSANSSELLGLLDKIEQSIQDGNCPGAASVAGQVATSVEKRADIDPKLRTALVDGFQRLQSLAEQPDCAGTATATTTTTTTDTTTTDTTPTRTTPTHTTPTQTTPTQTTPTQTTPTTPTNPTGGVPGGSGGIGTP